MEKPAWVIAWLLGLYDVMNFLLMIFLLKIMGQGSEALPGPNLGLVTDLEWVGPACWPWLWSNPVPGK